MANKRWITTEEAANLLGITPDAVRHLLWRGRIPGRRLGRDWRIDRRVLRELLETRQKQAPGASGSVPAREE